MSVLDWVGDSREQWRKLVKPGRVVETVDEDTGEIIDIKPDQDDPNDVEGLLVQFDYENAKGEETTRTILCKRCWESRNIIYVQGYCTLRQQLRTFRAERMTDLIEVRSGHHIGNPIEYFGHLADEPAPTYFRQPIAERVKPKVKAGKPYPAAKTSFQRYVDAGSEHVRNLETDAMWWHRKHRARRACIDGLRVLSYLALSDSIRTEEERNIEESYVESRLAMVGFDHDQSITDSMVEIAAGLAVPFRSLITAINRVAIDPNHYRLICDSARNMILADGRVDKIQSEAINRLLVAGHSITV